MDWRTLPASPRLHRCCWRRRASSVYGVDDDLLRDAPRPRSRAHVLPAPAGRLRGGRASSALVVVSLIDYERYRRWQWVLYGFARVHDRRRVRPRAGHTRLAALDHPGLRATSSRRSSPSCILIVALAAFLADRMDCWARGASPSARWLYAAVPAALVFVQPDFGTAMVIMVARAGAAVLLRHALDALRRARRAARSLAVLVAEGAAMAGLQIVKSYQLHACFVFLHPGHDPQARRLQHHPVDDRRGLGACPGAATWPRRRRSTSCPSTTPTSSSPWSASATASSARPCCSRSTRRSIWRALRIATLSRDMYGSIMAGGIAAVFLFQVFVNIGMTIGIMPVTGIPLPFVSYGGAALITDLMLVGLLESIHLRAPARGKRGLTWRSSVRNVRSILKAVADVRGTRPATARTLRGRHRADLLADAAPHAVGRRRRRAEAASAAPSTCSTPADFPTRPEALARWGRRLARAAQAPVRPELVPTVACCRAARLPAIVAAVRDTEAVAVDRPPGRRQAGLSRQGVRAARARHAGRQVGARAAHRRRSPARRGSPWRPRCRPARRAVIEHVIDAPPRRTASSAWSSSCPAPTCRP